jgi:glycosyltransferase involved in cell wall biosynthesis
MCTFNGATYLPEQLKSIANQTIQPHELIVCDDGSTDLTPSVLNDFASQCPFPVKIYISGKTLGVKKNFEKAISLCSGDVIVLSDQDDLWHPNKLQRFEQEFTSEPDTGLVFTDAEIVDAELNSTGTTMWQVLGFDSAARKALSIGKFDVLAPGWTVTGATMAFRSQYRNLCLPIPADLQMLHDGWIALVIASVAKVVAIPETLIRYRQHSDQQVGAPALRSIDSQMPFDSLNAAARRTWSSSGLPDILSALQRRLENQGAGYNCTRGLARTKRYRHHLVTRASLRANALQRLPAIVRELTTLRYHQYSNGFLSAAKDLFSLHLRSANHD